MKEIIHKIQRFLGMRAKSRLVPHGRRIPVYYLERVVDWIEI